MNTLLHKQRIKSIILFIFEILIVSGLFVASALFELDYYFLIAIGLTQYFTGSHQELLKT